MPERSGADFRREAHQGLGEFFGASAEGFADGVLHGFVEARLDALIGLDAEFAHLLQGPDPDVIFLFAADAIAVEADGVVAYFVEEDGEADGGAGIRGFDPIDGAAVGIGDGPGAAGHMPAPAAHTDAVFALHSADDLGEIAHAYLLYRQVIGRGLNRYGGHIDRIRRGGLVVTCGKIGFDGYPRVG